MCSLTEICGEGASVPCAGEQAEEAESAVSGRVSQCTVVYVSLLICTNKDVHFQALCYSL